MGTIQKYLALGVSLGLLGCGGELAMYNGRNLDGWETKGNWKAEPNGVLAIKPRAGERSWRRFDAYLWAEKRRARLGPSSIHLFLTQQRLAPPAYA